MVVVGLVSVCSSNKEDASEEKLQIVTCFYPVYDLTKKIMGDEGEVEMMVLTEAELLLRYISHVQELSDISNIATTRSLV
ncbi:hypothetical protein [Enterococcus sp. BWT-B8]|uniref:hypothetical protein n=1 Tax=Enterococcus sp. BWT-B8 TaxID=2885157 RepID=UPI001E62C950|nr:hypothetical protein [Enterococcus sp. BWT-B8]